MIRKFFSELIFVFCAASLMYSGPAMTLGVAVYGAQVYGLDTDGRLAQSALSDPTGVPYAKSKIVYDAYYANDAQNVLTLLGTGTHGNVDVVLASTTDAPASRSDSAALSPQNSSSSTPLIAGATVGGVILLVAIAAGLIAYQCRKTLVEPAFGKNVEQADEAFKGVVTGASDMVEDVTNSDVKNPFEG